MSVITVCSDGPMYAVTGGLGKRDSLGTCFVTGTILEDGVGTATGGNVTPVNTFITDT